MRYVCDITRIDIGRHSMVLTLNPLYHSFIVASSYLVCDLRKSMSSLLSLSLLPKQPILKSVTKSKEILLDSLITIKFIDLITDY